MTTAGNIFAPSLLVVEKPAPLYSGFTPTDIIPNGGVRALQNISITGSGSVYITDDRSAVGVPLFSNIYFVSATVDGDSTEVLSVSISISNNFEIVAYVYDQSGLHGSAVDINILIIGESAV